MRRFEVRSLIIHARAPAATRKVSRKGTHVPTLEHSPFLQSLFLSRGSMVEVVFRANWRAFAAGQPLLKESPAPAMLKSIALELQNRETSAVICLSGYTEGQKSIYLYVNVCLHV